MIVIKRDGREVEFDKERIYNAIIRAFKDVDGEISDNAKNISHDITEQISKNANKKLSVEEIQDLVEKKLMSSKRKDVAKSYILYRDNRTRVRHWNSQLMSIAKTKLNGSAIDNQNANVDEASFGGRKGEADSVIFKQFALDNCMSEMSRNRHLNNEIYIHDLDSYAVGQHNCFDSATEFITKRGVVKFGDLHEGQTVTVLDMNGNWQDAIVKKYGKQKMYELTFSSGLTKKTVVCTRNHRWVLLDGTITDNIQIGDELYKLPKSNINYEENEWLWCFGFVLGDGCDIVMRSKDKARITNNAMKIRLCGNKVQYLDKFLKCGWSIQERFDNGDITLSTRGNGAFKQNYLDNMMWRIASFDDLCNIFYGYLAADGHINDNGSIIISTSDIRVKKFIEDVSSVVGYHLWSFKERHDDTEYKKNRTLYEFYLTKQQTKTPWKLIDIKVSRNGSNGYKQTWCVEEPNTHTFTLQGGMVTGNCLTIPFDDLLANGFNTRQTDVRPANSVNTAFQLLAVIFQLQSLQQFGGVSASHLDWTMIPYVRKSFYKHYKNGVKYLEEKELDYSFNNWLSIEDNDYKVYSPKAYQYAMDMTVKEIGQAVEAMFHNLNTLQSRSGNQLPFTSINTGTCTLPEGRLITRAVLEGCIKGVGKLHRTSIFPCVIFQCMKGVNRKEGDPNYDLFRLALKSTSLRLYPNYSNTNWSGNEGYDINNPKTYFSTMGALAGHEHLYIKINDGEPIDLSIKELFNLCSNNQEIKGRPMQLYYNKKPLNIPTDENWRKHIKKNQNAEFSNDSGVYKITYIPEDVSYIGSASNVQRRFLEHKTNIRHKGGLDCGLFFEDSNINNYYFEVLEYTNDYKTAEKKYIMSVPNINYKGINHKFYKNVGLTRGKGLDIRPNIKMNPDIPQEYIDLRDRNIMVYDKDNKWTKINHIYKNDKMNTPYMMHITYQDNNKVYTLCCTEDHPLWTGKGYTKASKLKTTDKLYRADNKELSILDIKWNTERVDSYDIGTETGSFIGSDIIMHNCRTANGYDINGFGQLKDGRGNICPVTIIMPTLAMKTKITGDELNLSYDGKDLEVRLDAFMDTLDDAIFDAKDMLIERFNWICNQPMESAKFMYENNIMAGYVKEEGIKSALKHGTLAIGQLGLAETLQILIGENHTTEKGMELAKRIEALFKKRCAEFKEEYRLNFGVYYTPAENLCHTALKKFRDKYGVIPNVSDKDFFTNSMHIPVWEKVSPFEKIDLESQLTGYSSAGCITYVELEESVKHNIDGLEELVNYAMDKDIPYFAINVPNDTCLDCGYTNEMNDVCPKCGSNHIQRLRRVTGYLTNDYKTAFNLGKQDEVERRIKHDKVGVFNNEDK